MLWWCRCPEPVLQGVRLELCWAYRDVCVCPRSSVGVAKPRSQCDILQIYLQNLFISTKLFLLDDGMKFPTDVKPQILLGVIISAAIELESCSARGCVLRIQSSFSRSFPLSISPAHVSSPVEALFHRLLLSKGTKNPRPAFFVCFFWPQHSTSVCAYERTILK